MKRFLLPAAVLAAACTPAGALAASGTQRATVVSVNAARHTLQLVGADRTLHAYRYRGHARLRTGSVITFRRQGHTLSAIHVTGRVHRVSYLARVARSSGHGLVLRLADGRRLNLRAASPRAAIAHAASAAAPAINVQIVGLAAGETVLVNESVASDGSITITITLPAPAATPSSDGSGDVSGDTSGDATGAITAVSDSSITISTSGGDETFSVDPSEGLTDGFVVGDVVDVSYESGDGGTNQADDIEYVESDASGTVTAVSDSSLTITDSATGQTDTFSADPSQGLLDGVATGDQVDVTYHVNGTQLVADSVDDSGAEDSGD